MSKPVLFPLVCVQAKLPAPVSEHKFCPTRRWRFDYAFIESRVAVECEGGVWIGGRHTSGSGFVKDCEKYSEAAALGWRIIRVQPKDLLTSATIELIRRAINFPNNNTGGPAAAEPGRVIER